MYINYKYALLLKKRLKRNQGDIEYLKHLSSENRMPKYLLTGIYLIETKFRPWYLRIVENICVIIGALLNIIFKLPLKNYTIGVCQIGISSILNNSGKIIYKHARYIKYIEVKDLVYIVKAMFRRNNMVICSKIINSIYNRSKKTSNNYGQQLRHIGEEYNGRYSYGLLLENIVTHLDIN